MVNSCGEERLQLQLENRDLYRIHLTAQTWAAAASARRCVLFISVIIWSATPSSLSLDTQENRWLPHLSQLATRKGGRTRPAARFASKSRDDCRAVALFGRADDETVAVWKFVSCARYNTYPSNSTFSCARQFNRRQVLIRVAVSVPNQTGEFR